MGSFAIEASLFSFSASVDFVYFLLTLRSTAFDGVQRIELL